ncbi:helix-turn-helix domain-containing protein [Legionella bozemanae]|uniref:Integrase catalytic subunit n=2 Tax=Legionella bozemanae TaxID=447 RepID=A0A0W0S157_LEGBO|nr:helix-turn-helix domain-containing protein [Legionella bozemanae]KTC77263.1 integrase catalytic subunit [Legionella bozemanae]STO32878.1 Transposase and inactivated derivatives, IS30 family [Legionella bozemanae]STO34933.1 Transposase and inactivated derivatives, IS30 family [Legionella bozemanae]
MGKHYRHLTAQDRIQLYEGLFSGQSIAAIASHLGFHKSTIYRELERNSSRPGYRADWASQQYLSRKFHHGFKRNKFPELKKVIIARLKEGWSPQQISGRLKRSAGQCIISHETFMLISIVQQVKQRSFTNYCIKRDVFVIRAFNANDKNRHRKPKK